MTELHGSQPTSPNGEVVVYEAAAPHDDVSLEVRLERETLWLTQRQMADLFRTTASNVSPAPEERVRGRRAGPLSN